MRSMIETASACVSSLERFAFFVGPDWRWYVRRICVITTVFGRACGEPSLLGASPPHPPRSDAAARRAARREKGRRGLTFRGG